MDILIVMMMIIEISITNIGPDVLIQKFIQ